MALPDLIEIMPLDKPVRAEITVPGSKSITNRALILAALADGEVTLEGALWSEDTQVMTEALRRLGFEIKVEPDPEEFCNRAIMVKGLGGKIPNTGTLEKPLELFVGNAGTAARFLAAMVCLGQGSYRLSGVPRMHERPQAALFNALRELGYRLEAANNKLPAVTHGGSDAFHRGPDSKRNDEVAVERVPPAKRSCTVSIEESSQFASALLLCAKHEGWDVTVVGENAEESPYVAMTTKLIEAFPHRGGKVKIEPDASSGSYFLAAARVLWKAKINKRYEDIIVKSWPDSGWQTDAEYPRYQTSMESISRQADLADSIMIRIVVAPLEMPLGPTVPEGQVPNVSIDYSKQLPTAFKNLGRLRVQESDRVQALYDELRRCGAVIDWPDGLDELLVYSCSDRLHGAEIETYNDHRMAMCFAILGLKVPGIKIKNPACVKKTFPNFFQKLAAPPPKGLGAEIRDAKTGRKLGVDELFAD